MYMIPSYDSTTEPKSGSQRCNLPTSETGLRVFLALKRFFVLIQIFDHAEKAHPSRGD